jgi:hypothetical protein
MRFISPSLRQESTVKNALLLGNPPPLREQPTFYQFSNCGVYLYLLKSSIAPTSHRAKVGTTQIGEVVAQHRDCFSIGNNHFFASNND